MLKQLIALLDYMECELRYRLTPLPQLCRQASENASGSLRNVFQRLAQELDHQVSPDVLCCMHTAIGTTDGIPEVCGKQLLELGRTMGVFDLEGQLSGIHAVRGECDAAWRQMQENQDIRLRSYQTLGVCAGAALAILLI